MNAAAETIENDLTADTALQAVVNGKHYWELAPDDAKVPFITYSIRENVRATKDRRGNYDVVVRALGSTLTNAAGLADLAMTALRNQNYRYQGGTSGYVDSEAREGFIEMNFNFNLIKT